MILLCVSPLIFNFATRKYLNPYKLYLVFGKKAPANLLILSSWQSST